MKKLLLPVPEWCCPSPWAVPGDTEVVTINGVRYFRSEQVEKCRKVHVAGCAKED